MVKRACFLLGSCLIYLKTSDQAETSHSWLPFFFSDRVFSRCWTRKKGPFTTGFFSLWSFCFLLSQFTYGFVKRLGDLIGVNIDKMRQFSNCQSNYLRFIEIKLKMSPIVLHYFKNKYHFFPPCTHSNIQ